MKPTVFRPHVYVATALLTAIALTACGGGGGSSGGTTPVAPSLPPPPPPPPPPVNEAPEARADATPASLHEGQPFILDAAASTDPEGATLTYSWSQISGPPVTISNPALPTVELRAAEVTEDTEAVFRVSVSDTEHISTRNISVIFENISQTPALITTYTYHSTAPLPFRPVSLGMLAPNLSIIGAEETMGGPVSFYSVHRDADRTELAMFFRRAITRTFQQPSFVKLVTVAGQLFSPNLEVTDTEGSHIYGWPRNGGDELILLGETAHQDACSTTQLFSEQWQVVGRRNAGFELYENDWGRNTPPYSSEPVTVSNPVRQKGYTTTNSICGIQQTYFSVNRQPFRSPYGLLDLISLLGYNLDTQSLELYSQKQGIMLPEVDAFELTQSLRVDLNSSSSLELVDHLTIENTLLLLFSDGQHQGDHRLIVAGLDDDRNIVQSTYEWEIGAPRSFGKIDFLTRNPIGAEIVIFAPSSPQAIVFKPSDPFDWYGSLEGPYYFEVGLGAIAGGRLAFNFESYQGLITLHQDAQELKVFASPPY